MAWLLNAVPDAGLTATKPSTSNQVATEPEAGFPGAEALSGGKATLGRAWGAVFGYFFAGKKYQRKNHKNQLN